MYFQTLFFSNVFTLLRKRLLTKKRKKKQQYGRESYITLPEDKRLVEYGKKYYKIWENKTTSQVRPD